VQPLTECDEGAARTSELVGASLAPKNARQDLHPCGPDIAPDAP